MKKIFASIVLGVLLLPIMVSAADINPNKIEPIPGSPDKVFEVINLVIDWLFVILIVIAIFVVLLAAFTFLTSAGDPEKVAKARNYILYAVVAIVVAFLAEAIILLVQRIVMGQAG